MSSIRCRFPVLARHVSPLVAALASRACSCAQASARVANCHVLTEAAVPAATMPADLCTGRVPDGAPVPAACGYPTGAACKAPVGLAATFAPMRIAAE